MHIKKLQWDPELCRFFGVPQKILPEIRSSSEIYGDITEGPLRGVPISGVSHDHSANPLDFQSGCILDCERRVGGCFLVLTNQRFYLRRLFSYRQVV
jgi:glycerol kinase